MEMTKEIVSEMGKLLQMVKPNLVKCEFVSNDIEEYVVVTARNGYTYEINVSGNSAIATVAEVFNKMVSK